MPTSSGSHNYYLREVKTAFSPNYSKKDASPLHITRRNALLTRFGVVGFTLLFTIWGIVAMTQVYQKTHPSKYYLSPPPKYRQVILDAVDEGEGGGDGIGLVDMKPHTPLVHLKRHHWDNMERSYTRIYLENQTLADKAMDALQWKLSDVLFRGKGFTSCHMNLEDFIEKKVVDIDLNPDNYDDEKGKVCIEPLLVYTWLFVSKSMLGHPYNPLQLKEVGRHTRAFTHLYTLVVDNDDDIRRLPFIVVDEDRAVFPQKAFSVLKQLQIQLFPWLLVSDLHSFRWRSSSKSASTPTNGKGLFKDPAVLFELREYKQSSSGSLFFHDRMIGDGVKGKLMERERKREKEREGVSVYDWVGCGSKT